MLAEMILRGLSRPVGVEDYSEGATEGTGEQALDLLKHAFPDLGDLIGGKVVVDFGCGNGHQAVAMARQYGCSKVYGLDTNEATLKRAIGLHGSADVKFVSEIPAALVGEVDVIVSQDSMEHFPDPAGVLEAMRRMLKPGGKILMTFGPLWYSPYGSHMHFFCKVPWVNLLFPEKAVMKVRSRYRNDGAARYEDVESGLNKMSVAKFEKIVAASGFDLERIQYQCVKGLNISRLPVLRELLVNHIHCALAKPPDD